MNLNVGCGLDIRDGWLNVDVTGWAEYPDGPAVPVTIADARDLAAWHGMADTVLLSHVLHLFNYDAADGVLAECTACLAPGGQLVVVEADVLGVVRYHPEVALGVVSADVEPTDAGRLLRWVSWHGTRRSLWSWESLIERLERLGLRTEVWWPHQSPGGAWAGERRRESVVVVGHRDRPA